MLKLDLDTRQLPTIGQWIGRAARAGVKIRALALTRSPSGRGWHVWVRVTPAPRTAMETVALQAVLGSDLLRECYNINRARAVDAGKCSTFWRRRWNVFYGEGR